jgi:thiol-disulfide isomerase/thioredoxin
MKKKLLCLIILLFACNVFATNFKEDDPKKGWFWYKDPIVKQENKEVKKTKKNESEETKVTIITPPKKEDIKEDIKEKQEEKTVNTGPEDFDFPLTDEAKRVPVIANFLKEPNEENAKKFLAWQSKYFNHVSQISRSLRNTYLNYGDSIYQLEGYAEQPLAVPIGARNSQKIYKNAFEKAKEKVGLLFFYKKGCEFCEAEKPIISQFAQKYDIEVRGIVYNEKDIDNTLAFSSKFAPGLFYKFNITSVPTFAVYYPEKEKFQVIAKGYTPMSSIELNLKSFLLQENIITKDEFLKQWKGEYTDIFYNTLSNSKADTENLLFNGGINTLGGIQ